MNTKKLILNIVEIILHSTTCQAKGVRLNGALKGVTLQLSGKWLGGKPACMGKKKKTQELACSS